MWPRRCGAPLPSECSRGSVHNVPVKGLVSYWVCYCHFKFKSMGIIYIYKNLMPVSSSELCVTGTNGERDNCIFVYQLNSRTGDWSFPLPSRWSLWCCEVLNSLWSQWFRRWGLHHVSGLGSSFLVRLQACRSGVLWNELTVLLPSKVGGSGISLALWLNWLEASLSCFSLPLGSMLYHHTHIIVMFSGLLLCKSTTDWGWFSM